MRCVALGLALLAVAAVGGCGLEEREDYLVGRRCNPDFETPCDDEQVCLPHKFDASPSDFRCRDASSLLSTAAVPNPPLAFCVLGTYDCPPELVCRPDRVRFRDGAPRREVCQDPDVPFLIPEEGEGQ